MIVFA